MKNTRQLFSLITLVIIGTLVACTSSAELTRKPDCSYAATAQAGCVFCDIVAGCKPAHVIYETPEIIVIKKPHPVEGVNCLIIPKKHIRDLNAINDNDPYDADIVNKVRKVAVHLSKNMLTAPGHYTLICNNGAESAQTVFHTHWHFIAKKSRFKPNVVIKDSIDKPC
jgi:histidine triad (HIT) family protein